MRLFANKRLVLCALAACLLLACACLCGCRFTDVIRETVYDQSAEEVDESADPIVTLLPPDEEDEQMDDEREDEEIDEVQERSDIETVLGILGDGDSDEAASLIYDISGIEFGSGQATGSASATSKNASETNEAQAGEDSGDEGNDGSGMVVGQGSGSDKGSLGTVMDSGEYEDLPTDVSTIAAAGEYASIVCALGGADALAATSADFIEAAASVSDAWKSVAKLSCAFTDDGDGTLASGGLNTLLELHEAGACDAVLVESTSVLGSSNLSALKEAGIAVYTVSLADLDSIESTVSAVGKLLKDATDGESVSLASSYSKLCAEVTKTCSGDSGLYTLYVAKWDAAATYTVKSNGTTILSGTGLAATYTGAAAATSDFLACAGLSNIPTLSAFSNYSTKTGLYWLNQFKVTSATISFTAGNLSSVSWTSKGSANIPFRELLVAYDGNADNTAQTRLGSTSYPALIAEDVEVAEGIINSRDNGGAYAPASLFDAYNAVDILGFKYDSDHYVETFIGNGRTTGADCYKVYTAPHGVYSSWTGGSMESILLSAWANYKFYGSYSSSDLKELVVDFYTEFYGASSVDYSAIMQDAGE